MLLKCSNLDKRMTIPSKGKGKIQRTASGLKMTVSATALNSKTHRKVLRIPAKRHPGKALPGKLSSISKHSPGKFTSGKKILNRPNLPPCDNSNDSGLGFDQHLENNNLTTSIDNRTTSATIRSNPLIFNTQRTLNADCDNTARNICWPGGGGGGGGGRRGDGNNISKHQKLSNHLNNNSSNNNNNNIEIDNSDDACSNDTFMLAQRNKEDGTMNVREAGAGANHAKHLNTNITRNVYRVQQRRVAAPCQVQGNQNISKDGKSQLHILVQPEQQHRARYQTEGSRGAVKDRSGNGFPVVKLIGYNKPAILQVFIGTDIGRVTPHMFYQACKVSGKNSTPCFEKKVDGTMYIEIELKPENEMMVTCDCVGILKERNVDVELRFPNQAEPRNKKKSTRCRMVFRVQIESDGGNTELLQACSQQIICTQPPGVPEICKKSLTSCPSNGGLELFIIGKNFLKDSRVIFKGKKLYDNDTTGLSSMHSVWEESVVPDKEYLQPNHLVCTVPSYFNQDITEGVTVQIYVVSSGKKSESQNFVYLPKDSYSILSVSATTSNNINKLQTHGSLQLTTPQDIQYGNESNDKNSLSLWNSSALEQKSEIDAGMMPPPTALPISLRRPSQTSTVTIQNEQQISSPMDLKSEMMDECSQNSMDCIRTTSAPTDENSNISMIVNENSMDHVTSIPMNINMTNGHMDMITNAEEMKVIDLRVKQEQMAAQLQAYVNSNSNQMLPSLQEMSTNVAQIVSPSQESSMVFQQQIINNVSQAQPTSTFLDNLCNSTTEMLDIQSSSNSNSPDSILTSANHSPHTQDIILNSQQVVLSTQNMPQMMSTNNSQSRHSMSPEIILDPAVSPTMMCQSNTDTSNLLSGMSLPQSSQDVMLNNLIQSPLSQQNDALHMTHKPAPVAVKNMILHAANEILTQTNNPLNALITMDQAILQNQDANVNALLINQTQTSSSSGHQMQNIPMYHTNTSQENSMHNHMINQNGMLLTQTDQTMQTRDNSFIHCDSNGNLHEIPNLNQESHLQNITLEQNMLNDTQKIVSQAGGGGGVSTTTTTTIPQELTTMSDHDLISYINTSCFDQI